MKPSFLARYPGQSRHIRYNKGQDEEARIGRREVEAGRRV